MLSRVTADAGFAFFRLDRGSARSMQGSLGEIDGRWAFRATGVPPPLTLDDGTIVRPEPALVPEREQRGYSTLQGLVVTGLGAPAMQGDGAALLPLTPP